MYRLCRGGKHENRHSQLRIQEGLCCFGHVGTVSEMVLGMGRSWHFV